MRWIAIAALGWAAGCATDQVRPNDASMRDAGRDIGRDPAMYLDAGRDAPFDAGRDGCASGAGDGSIDASRDVAADAFQDSGACSIDFDGLVAQLAEARCEMLRRCDFMGLFFLYSGVPDSACVDDGTLWLANAIDFGGYREAIERGTVVLDGCEVTTCAAATAAEPCYGREGLYPSLVDPACRQMFVGQLADGAPCSFDGECGLDGRCPPPTSGTCPGSVCEHVPQLGEACSDSCALGLWCDPTTHSCAAQLPLGSPCDPDLGGFPCAHGVRCLATNTACASRGTCALIQPGVVGAPCGDHVGPCDVGLVCDFATLTTNVCRPARTDGVCLADEISAMRTRDCAPPARCQYRSTTRIGDCVRVPQIGEPCGPPSSYFICDEDAWCNAGVCAALGVLGAPCTHDGDCWSFLCAAGRCANRPCMLP